LLTLLTLFLSGWRSQLSDRRREDLGEKRLPLRQRGQGHAHALRRLNL